MIRATGTEWHVLLVTIVIDLSYLYPVTSTIPHPIHQASEKRFYDLP